MNVYINIKAYIDYSTYIFQEGFIKIPDKFNPYWLNKRQFMIQNDVAKDFIEFLKENDAEIFYRYSREDDWTEYIYKTTK